MTAPESSAIEIEPGSLCFLEAFETASDSFRHAKTAAMARDMGQLTGFHDDLPVEIWPLLRLVFDDVLGAAPPMRFLHQVDYFVQCMLHEVRQAESPAFSTKAQGAAAGLLLALQDRRFQQHQPIAAGAWPLQAWLTHLPLIDQAYLSLWTWNSGVSIGEPLFRAGTDRLEIVSNGRVLAERTRDAADHAFAFVDATSLPLALLEESLTHTLPKALAASRFGRIFSWGRGVWPAAARAIEDATFFVRGTDCVEQGQWQSGSAAHEPGSVYVTLRETDFLHAFEGLLHESMHQRIYLLERLHSLTRHSQRLYRHKWRTDDRPIRGVLLAAHAFAAVTRYYAICLDAPKTPRKDALRAEFQDTWDGVTNAVRTLLTSDALTETGAFVAELIDKNQEVSRQMVHRS